MKPLHLALLAAAAVGGVLLLTHESEGDPNKPKLDPLPPMPSREELLRRGEQLAAQAKADPGSIRFMDPAELRILSREAFESGHGALGAELAMLTVRAEALQKGLPDPVPPPPVAAPPAPAPAQPRQPRQRPAPGMLPQDLAAEVVRLLNPNLTPTQAEVRAALDRVYQFDGFIDTKSKLEALLHKLGG